GPPGAAYEVVLRCMGCWHTQDPRDKNTVHAAQASAGATADLNSGLTPTMLLDVGLRTAIYIRSHTGRGSCRNSFVICMLCCEPGADCWLILCSWAGWDTLNPSVARLSAR